MKTKKIWIVSIMASIFFFGCSGPRPKMLGVNDNHLAPCPDKPNCVSSQTEEKKHFVTPISYKGERQDAIQIMKLVLSGRDRTLIVNETDSYLHAECRSRVFGFVDDAEFYFPEEEHIIHVRSAARVGYSDFGVNRKRVEEIRTEFEKRMNE